MNLLTVSEYAHRAGVSPQYIRKLIAAGRLQAEKRNPRLLLIPEGAEIQPRSKKS